MAAWDSRAAVAALPLIRWQSTAWRAHHRRYAAADPGGSLKVSGRYNRGLDRFPAKEAFSALYLALRDAVCLGEMLRHLSPDRLPRLAHLVLSELAVSLFAVADARDPGRLGLPPEALWHDTDYRVPQALAAAARAHGAEGLLVPSVTGLGDNLVVFSNGLRPNSRLELVRAVTPRLYVG